MKSSALKQRRIVTLAFSIMLLAFLNSSMTFSQSEDEASTWGRTFGDRGDERAQSLLQTDDGEYVILGNKGYDIWLLKVDSNGSKIWESTFGGSNDDIGYSVQQTAEGGYIIAGSTKSYSSGGLWLIKTDSNGAKEWDRTYGGPNHVKGRYWIQNTSDGGYIVTGSTNLFGKGGWDMWVLKLDSNGTENWTKSFGGLYDDLGYSVQETSDGGYIVAGLTKSFGVGANDVYIVKLDLDGKKMWNRTWGGSGDEKVYSIQRTADGGHVVAAVKDGDYLIVKMNSDGDRIWETTLDGNGDAYYSVQQTSDGGYVVAGTKWGSYKPEDVWVVRLNPEGKVIRDRTFGGMGDDFGISAQETPDGGFIVLGSTESFGAGYSDIWLIKTDPNFYVGD
jgi:hypothetical protein